MATRQSDIGIGRSGLMHYRAQTVDFLAQISSITFHFMSQKPPAIASYETLVLPFDEIVWAFLAGSALVASALLGLMSICWKRAKLATSMKKSVFPAWESTLNPLTSTS